MFTYIGIVFAAALGALLYYSFAWSGRNIFVAFLAPTDKSSFERLKLLFTPYVLCTLAEYEAGGFMTKSFIPAKTLAALAGMMIMLFLFHCFRKRIGFHTDMVALAAGLLTAAAVTHLLLPLPLLSVFGVMLLCDTLLIAMVLSFAAFTIYPPKGRLFNEPPA